MRATVKAWRGVRREICHEQCEGWVNKRVIDGWWVGGLRASRWESSSSSWGTNSTLLVRILSFFLSHPNEQNDRGQKDRPSSATVCVCDDHLKLPYCSLCCLINSFHLNTFSLSLSLHVHIHDNSSGSASKLIEGHIICRYLHSSSLPLSLHFFCHCPVFENCKTRSQYVSLSLPLALYLLSSLISEFLPSTWQKAGRGGKPRLIPFANKRKPVRESSE